MPLRDSRRTSITRGVLGGTTASLLLPPLPAKRPTEPKASDGGTVIRRLSPTHMPAMLNGRLNQCINFNA